MELFQPKTVKVGADCEMFVLPLTPGSTATVIVPRPMTGDEWAQMLTLLEAMRPALVADPEPAPARDDWRPHRPGGADAED